MSSDAELEDRLKTVCGEEYAKGASAEDVISALDSVRDRFKRMQEADL